MPEQDGSDRLNRLEQAMKDLQDTLLVTVEIERRQSALLREHSERIVSIEANLARSAELHREADERLNALIAIVDGMIRNRPPQA
jgi:hypothetical protein